MRRKLIVLAVLAIGVAVALVLWQRDDSSTSTTASSTKIGSAKARTTKQRAGEPLDWFAQRDVKARRVAGIVLHDDKPIAGATVRLANKLTTAGAIETPAITTDEQGRFDFGLQPATAYVIVAEKPKLVGTIVSIDLRSPTFAYDDLRVVLHACAASLRGTIRDQAGGVIPGARVARASWATTTDVGVDADDNGVYELCLPVGDNMVNVGADGYAQLIDNVSAYGPLQRDFALSPEAVVGGRVVHAGSPVAGALVELRADEGYRRTSPTLYATSDEYGAFRFEGASPGQLEVVASADGLASKPVYLVAEVAAKQDEVVVELLATYSVSGKVVERGGSKPIGGISVNVQARDIEPMRFVDQYAVSQPDGTFTITGLFPNEYTPVIRLYDIVNTPPKVVIANADVGNVVLEIDRAGSIAGRITHAGKPVDGVQISARSSGRGRSTISDHAGNYVIRDLAAGTYSLYAESKRVGAFTNGPSITLGRAEHKTGVEIDMNLAGSIAGVVVDQHGAPVPNVMVRFSLLRGSDFGVATTAADGSFLATALSGGGEYAYEVRPDQDSAFAFPPADRKRHPPIAVNDGTTRVTGVRIKIRIDPQHSIAGRVVDASGKPVADALVGVDGVASARQARRSDETGAFTVSGLPAGSYSLHATAGARTVRASNIAAGRTNVELRLEEPGEIDGTIENYTAVPDVIATNETTGQRYRVTATKSSFRIRNLPRGGYAVAASSSSGVDMQYVTVTPGEIAKVTLSARGYATIEGTLVDARRAPLRDRRCSCMSEDLHERRAATTDAAGVFRCERVVAGKQFVNCTGVANKVIEVVAGQTTRVELVEKPPTDAPRFRRARHGLSLEVQFDDLFVKGVEKGSPAERAGLQVGDAILELDGDAIDNDRYMMIERLETSPGKTFKITVERSEKEHVLSLTPEAVD